MSDIVQVMTSPTTTKELVEALRRLYGPPDEGSAKPLRYVIYARKSTDDSENQTRSLKDQIDECFSYIDKNDLVLGRPSVVQEAISAKQSGKRPGFAAMLEDIKAGKYDGILAWHPDRLARNMKDAGEIIDLLDKGVIKDLRFVSFNFENTPSGLLHLGITFVIAKQYSDQLSRNVARGIEHAIKDGEYINRPKHGYCKDPEQRLRPDGRNFDLIKRVFALRLELKTYDEIAAFLNENHYERAYADGSHKSYKWTKQGILKLLREPVYAGVVAYGESNIADLTELYDFVPAVSVKDFMRVNQLTSNSQLVKLANSYRKGEDVKSNLLRGMVLCDECGYPMSTGLTPKKTKGGVTRYFYYRCNTEGCARCDKSTRAKAIVSFVNGFLAERPFSSKTAYDHYEKEMQRVEAERNRDRRILLNRLRGREKELTGRQVRIKEFLLDEKNEGFSEGFKQDLVKAEADHKKMQTDIAKLEGIIAAQKSARLLMPEFLEQMDKIAQIIASTSDMTELDFCIRKVFSNFRVRGEKVTEATLSEPFSALAGPKVTLGAP